jgi:hypothetical protein
LSPVFDGDALEGASGLLTRSLEAVEDAMELDALDDPITDADERSFEVTAGGVLAASQTAEAPRKLQNLRHLQEAGTGYYCV